jgi:hypothetical protein
MTEPIPVETLLAELSEDADAWVLQDEQSKLYVTIPHPTYPGRQPIHFFLKREDAAAVLMELVEENERLRDKNIFPVKVKLLEALRRIAADATPGNADGFVVHSPNEVYEYVRDRL